MSYCVYYQAHVRTYDCWFFVAALRSFEHMCFDRTLNVQENLFEFFVPPAMEPTFLQVMTHFQQEGMVSNLQKLPNRYAEMLA
jgi:hypothetical protein